jgi:hypothetical protein
MVFEFEKNAWMYPWKRILLKTGIRLKLIHLAGKNISWSLAPDKCQKSQQGQYIERDDARFLDVMKHDFAAIESWY